MGKLTAIKVRNAEPGRHVDGDGLMLDVKPTGRGFWVLRYTFGGKRRDLGIGPASGSDAVTLAVARDLAAEARRKAKAGVDPMAERAAGKAVAKAEASPEPEAKARPLTFRDVAEKYITAHAPAWKSAKHGDQWRATLQQHAYAHIGDAPVASVGKGDVMAVLEPIWTKTPETANRVRGRIEAVLDYAKARGWREGDNPAAWRGNLAHVLPRRSKLAPVQHFAALPYEDVGAFMAELRTRDGMAAQALAFTILTAARSGETRGATWGEFDFKARVWTVPAARMKGSKEHRVPLSDAALAILATLRTPDSRPAGLVFPSPYGDGTKPLSDMTLTAVIVRMNESPEGDAAAPRWVDRHGKPITVHGTARSTFRDWTAEATSYPREVAEAALAHTVRDKVEAAYRRGDLFDKRRHMMQAWAEYCARPAAPASAEVVPIRATVGA